MSVNLITKSGGNAYHGAAEYAFTNNHFESNNITAELRAQGVVSAPKLITRKDGGGQLGGKTHSGQAVVFRRPALSEGHQGNSVCHAA